MGGGASKEQITARLDELDKKELEINLKLKDLQIQLNEMLPEEERIKVNENLRADGEIPEMGEYTPSEAPSNKKESKKKGKEDSDSEEEEEEEEEEESENEEEEEEEEEENEDESEESAPKKKKGKK